MVGVVHRVVVDEHNGSKDEGIDVVTGMVLEDESARFCFIRMP